MQLLIFQLLNIVVFQNDDNAQRLTLHISGDYDAFVESDPAFKEAKISVSEIFREMAGLRARATQRIQSVVFHRLDIIQRMFKTTLGVELPAGVGELLKAVARRHDIVHRNCVAKDGTAFQVTRKEVSDLLDLTERFITELSGRVDGVIRKSDPVKAPKPPEAL